MKFYKICIIFLFLLMFSIGAVCAEDVNQTSQDTLEITGDDVISADEGTYTDLLNELNSAQSGRVDLSKDYKYGPGKDKMNYISIEDFSTKFVIDGKNHVIDGNGQTYIFKFIRVSDLTLKNLIIRNCNGSAIIMDDVALTLENVVFEDNYDTSSGGAIYAEQSTIISNKNTFKNNYAEKGASLYLYKSVFKSDGDLFVSNKPVYWSMIYGQNPLYII